MTFKLDMMIKIDISETKGLIPVTNQDIPKYGKWNIDYYTRYKRPDGSDEVKYFRKPKK